MKSARLTVAVLIPLLFACAPKKPEIPMTEVPAGPLVQSLEQQQRSFRGLKATASVRIVKSGHKRTLENVGIVLDGQRRFRVEAYGPLGQTLMTLVWDGKNVFLRRQGGDAIERLGRDGIAHVLGADIEARELAALLSGTLPSPVRPARAVQFCGQNGACVLTMSYDGRERRVTVSYGASLNAAEPQVVSQELYRSGELIYKARFDRIEAIAGCRLPMKIEIENDDHDLLLTVEYTGDIGVNALINDDAFTLSEEEKGG